MANEVLGAKASAAWQAWERLNQCPAWSEDASRLREEYRTACREASPLRGEVIAPGQTLRRAPVAEQSKPEAASWFLYKDNSTGRGMDGFEAAAERMRTLAYFIGAGLAGFLITIPIMCATGFPISPFLLLASPIAGMIYGSWRYTKNPNYRSIWG